MPGISVPSVQAATYSPTVASPPLRPVAPEERIGALDLLRGWAMFGVLWSNLNDDYITRGPSTALDHALNFTQNWLLESRFYSLLIILFGIGFGIQLTRANRAGRDVRTTYYRRTAALLAIGVIHGTLIWHGDILTIYALVAFALVMFRGSSTRSILIAALVLFFVGPVVVAEAKMFAGLRVMVPSPSHALVYEHGTWMQIERARVDDYLQWLGRWGLGSYPAILASFLIGLWAVKSGYMRRVFDEPKQTFRLLVICVVAMAVGYANWFWSARFYPVATPPKGFVGGFPFPYFQLAQLRQFVLRFFDWDTIGGALSYACVLVLLWQRPAGQRALRPLAVTGRMALTTYLTQSIVCTLLFYNYGLDWYGHVGFTGVFAITMVLFAAQMAMSTWWLRRFRYGPAEWFWRTLTYGGAPAMRIHAGDV